MHDKFSDDQNEDNESKSMNEDEQFKTKKCIQINYFFKTYENKEEWEKNNNKHIALVDNDEVEEEEVEEIKFIDDESKMIKGKVIKNNKKQAKTSNEQNHKSESNERLSNDDVDYEKELSKSKKLEIELRKYNELAHADYDTLNKKSMKLFRATFF